MVIIISRSLKGKQILWNVLLGNGYATLHLHIKCSWLLWVMTYLNRLIQCIDAMIRLEIIEKCKLTKWNPKLYTSFSNIIAFLRSAQWKRAIFGCYLFKCQFTFSFVNKGKIILFHTIWYIQYFSSTPLSSVYLLYFFSMKNLIAVCLC